ncbi:hypothetical protein BO70DRAFT_363488 [Aspergillus heteromorphus CBS 117.55]|uniref:Uncharacterized protein n=1 Tax=Aspergillus heteromorphus CBS 117.55 TaxID=1448321 RepID=A0A317W072_9EURO|nr:uncharacterized protein BO70DRAFT_363488 [Aspergillus heteromorphus CBS 117.55]PWY77540.1 hypothetical protein BO70DRAFT_363488 [Aspergillus heteromorphus CBS 117.55]
MSTTRILHPVSRLTSAARGLLSRSVRQPAVISGVQSRLNSGLAKEWQGRGSEEHPVNRTKKRDVTDPVTDASASAMKDREESEGVADAARPQGTTGRGGQEHGKKAKEEHPKAPEPVIGMNDERGQKGH